MNSRVSLSGLDSAFLSLETPSTPMHVMGTFVLDVSSASGGYSYERVLRLVEERAPALAPLRRRLIAVPFGLDHPVWVDDPALDVRRHVHRVQAPAPGSDRVLADLVVRIASQPLDRGRPLWQLSVVEGLAEGQVALVFKVHHAVADGVSAALLLLLRRFRNRRLRPLGAPGGGHRARLRCGCSQVPQDRPEEAVGRVARRGRRCDAGPRLGGRPGELGEWKRSEAA